RLQDADGDFGAVAPLLGPHRLEPPAARNGDSKGKPKQFTNGKAKHRQLLAASAVSCNLVLKHQQRPGEAERRKPAWSCLRRRRKGRPRNPHAASQLGPRLRSKAVGVSWSDTYNLLACEKNHAPASRPFVRGWPADGKNVNACPTRTFYMAKAG